MSLEVKTRASSRCIQEHTTKTKNSHIATTNMKCNQNVTTIVIRQLILQNYKYKHKIKHGGDKIESDGEKCVFLNK